MILFFRQTLNIEIIVDCPLLLLNDNNTRFIQDIVPGENVLNNIFTFGLGKATIYVTINDFKWIFKTYIIGPFVFPLN
jgi:hypothetical protein